MINTTVTWPGIWDDPTEIHPQHHQETPKGEEVNQGPPATMNNEDKITIARRTNKTLERRKEEIWGIDNSPYMTDIQKCEMLTNILTDVALHQAYAQMGPGVRPDMNSIKDNLAKRDLAWDDLHQGISAATKKGREHLHGFVSRETTKTSIAWLREHKVHIPTSLDELDLWALAKEHHKSQMTRYGTQCHRTDQLIILRPASLYQTVMVPYASSHIRRLEEGHTTHTSDVGISGVLHRYLEKMAGQPEEIKRKHPDELKGNPHLQNLMAEPTTELVTEVIKALNGKAMASTLTVNLLKTITLTSWVEQQPKTKAHINRDRASQKLAHIKTLKRHNSEEANRLGTGPTPAPPLPEPLPTQKEVTIQPTMTTKVMRLIIKRAFKARDYPKSEKKGTITGLPKPGQRGLIRSTDTIRPLTVSPIIGRVINAVLAKRTGRALADNHILDPASHAFLPGLSIHDCIATWTLVELVPQNK